MEQPRDVRLECERDARQDVRVDAREALLVVANRVGRNAHRYGELDPLHVLSFPRLLDPGTYALAMHSAGDYRTLSRLRQAPSCVIIRTSDMTTALSCEVGRYGVVPQTRMRPVALSPEEVGARIAKARADKSPKPWSQFDLALAMGVAPSTIYRWEKGRLPSMTELMKLAEVLELPATELTEPPEHRAQLDDLMTAVQGLRELVELMRDEAERGRLAALVSLESIDRRLSKLEARRAPRASGSSQA